jgi:hypothetical protein
MNRFFPYVVLLAAITLAGIAAYYSVFGLSKLFSAQSTAVIIMASVLEVSKLISASYLHRYWSQVSTTIRIYLTTAVIVLMSITSLGIYGFLVSAYQDTARRLQTDTYQIDILNKKLERYTIQLQNIQTELGTISTTINGLTTGLANNTQQYTDRSGNLVVTTNAANRRAIQMQLDQATQRQNKLTAAESTLQDSVTKLDLAIIDAETGSDAAAELGPLLYVAKLSGQEIDTIVNWFILLFIFVFDPLAIILLLAANQVLHKSSHIELSESTVPTVDIFEPTLFQPADVTDTTVFDNEEYFDVMSESVTVSQVTSEQPVPQTNSTAPLHKYTKVIS